MFKEETAIEQFLRISKEKREKWIKESIALIEKNNWQTPEYLEWIKKQKNGNR